MTTPTTSVSSRTPATIQSAELLSRKKPPVALLPTGGQLEFHVAVDHLANHVIVERRSSPAQTGDQFGVIGQLADDLV